MCGISGIAQPGGEIDPRLLRRMCDAMRHRGPDGRGLHAEPGIGLGVQRLAIIDVEGGDQPIFNEDGTVAVIQNGEIYNFAELREELLAKGHELRTHSDTEVLVHLYEEHGRHFVERLRGMFAFALWDRRRRTLLLGRDRVGKKPLFYARVGGRLHFASEVRTLLEDPRVPRDVDHDAIEAYLALQYVPDPLSAFRAVRKLAPATTLEFGPDGGVDLRTYWRLERGRGLAGVPAPQLAEQLREQLREATRLRMVGEVPLGAFLSGGIDSSAIVATMAGLSSRPVRTFSIAFGEAEWDESAHAREVARRFACDHEELRVEPDALRSMPAIARHHGEPFADPSAIPTFALSEMTSRHVTVALSGDGGDESFAGYNRYVRGLQVGRGDRIPAPLRRVASAVGDRIGESAREQSLRSRAVRLARALGAPPWSRYATGMTAWGPARRQRLLAAEFAAALRTPGNPERIYAEAWAASSAATPVERMMDTDLATYLPGDLLPKVDIASMAHSLEVRAPFLDHVFMEWAAQLPPESRVQGGGGKAVLKAAMRGVLPDTVLDRPKMGFGTPLAEWFRGPLRDLPAERLLDPGAAAAGWFERVEIERTIAEHHERLADHSLRLWVLLQLESWHQEVVRAPVRDEAAA